MKRFKTGFRVVIKGCALNGYPVGADHWSTRYSDDLVAQAKVLRRDGLTYSAIAAALGGPSRAQVHRWITGAGRPQPVRKIARRVRSG